MYYNMGKRMGTMRKKKKTIQTNSDEHKVECPDCPTEASVYWDIRYNGYRGTCEVCETNWPES